MKGRGALLSDNTLLRAVADQRKVIFWTISLRQLFRNAHISIHLGTTEISNRMWRHVRLQTAVALVDESAVVWRGDHTLPISSQGVKILGSPVGHQGDVSAL